MGAETKELCVDYLGCQQAMCPLCDYLQICPLHNKIDALRAEVERLRAHLAEVAHEAAGVIYLDDSSDYRSALWGVVSKLDPVQAAQLELGTWRFAEEQTHG